MSKREQWWRGCQKCAGRGRTFDDDGEWTCDCQDKSPGYVVPAHPAAGSWRTDVENAPRDESLLVMYGGYPWFASWHGEQWWIGTGMEGDVLKDLSGITAYAIINPPEAADA